MHLSFEIRSYVLSEAMPRNCFSGVHFTMLNYLGTPESQLLLILAKEFAKSRVMLIFQHTEYKNSGIIEDSTKILRKVQ